MSAGLWALREPFDNPGLSLPLDQDRMAPRDASQFMCSQVPTRGLQAGPWGLLSADRAAYGPLSGGG